MGLVEMKKDLSILVALLIMAEESRNILTSNEISALKTSVAALSLEVESLEG